MKKTLAILLALAMTALLASCEKEVPAADDTIGETETETENTENTETEGEDEGEEADEEIPVMTYAEYAEAEADTKVCVETYVQAHQSWWQDTVTVYAASEDGAYFLYNLACSEKDAEKLVPGTKLRVTGYKSVWEGEVEIVEGKFEFVEGGDTYIAEPEDVTALLGTDALEEAQNKLVSFKGLTVEPIGEGTDAAFFYKYDNSGAEGDDLYFNVSLDGNTYSFSVESYLTGAGTEVYEAVKNLKVGDVIDAEGFLYWYNGANPHITSVKAAE